MSMMRKLFRPAAGQTHARYEAAFVNGTAVYPGDLVCWDVTAPTDQGSSGVLEGKTLGATDFLFVILPPANSSGRQAGIVQGPTINRASGATALTNDTVAVVQTWGVCPDVFAVTSTDSAAGILLTAAATTGGVTQILGTAAEATTALSSVTVVGFALNAQATDHTRATVATEPGLDAFIRCDW